MLLALDDDTICGWGNESALDLSYCRLCVDREGICGWTPDRASGRNPGAYSGNLDDCNRVDKRILYIFLALRRKAERVDIVAEALKGSCAPVVQLRY